MGWKGVEGLEGLEGLEGVERGGRAGRGWKGWKGWKGVEGVAWGVTSSRLKWGWTNRKVGHRSLALGPAAVPGSALEVAPF